MAKTVETVMKSVASSNLAAVGYDAATKTMHVEFKNGTMYEYTGVPEEIYATLLSAESVGSYFHVNIRNAYTYSKV